MMDFDQAVNKLNRDHDNLRKSATQRRSHLKQIERNRKARVVAQKRLRDKQILEEKRRVWCQRYMEEWEHRLNVVDLKSRGDTVVANVDNSAVGSSNNITIGTKLKAVSVWGDGDRITLPVSFLSELTERNLLTSNGGKQQPLSFRIGISNPESKETVFSSDLKRKAELAIPSLSKDEINDINMEEDDNGEEENDLDSVLYLQELNHRYISYTYGTVLEFTAEEGCIGIPVTIAKALLHPMNNKVGSKGMNIESTFTIDPAEASLAKQDTDNLKTMDVDQNYTENDERLPGHIAYSSFPVPLSPLTIQLATPPRGTGCTLSPKTPQTFHTIPNVKLSLEQSIIQTRATLSVGQEIDCWYRGKCEKLVVDKVLPADFGVVGCIDTDITVDFTSSAKDVEEDQNIKGNKTIPQKKVSEKIEKSLGGGYILGGGNNHGAQNESNVTSNAKSEKIKTKETVAQRKQDLSIPPPPSAPSETTCTILIRGQCSSKQRLFDLETTNVTQLFDYVLQQPSLWMTKGEQQDPQEGQCTRKFRLVTRYPRTVLALDENGAAGANGKSLLECGFKGGINAQVMLLMEWI